MHFLREIWVNYVVDEEFGHNIHEFFEWRKNDEIELFDVIPLVIIEPLLFTQIENTLIELPKELLKFVYNKSCKMKSGKRVIQNYCFVATDGTRIIAIDTHGTRIPLRKSRLIPRNELQIFEISSKHIEKSEYNSFPVNFENNSLDIQFDNCGLTRTEKGLKNIVLYALKLINSRQNISEAKYWIKEFDSNLNVDHKKFSELYDILYSKFQENWTKEIEVNGKKLIKGNETLEKLWKSESECIVKNAYTR